MAARESQRYLIAVIVLILLTLVLALVAVLVFLRSNELADSSKQWEAKANLAATERRAQEIKNDILLAYLGDMGVSLAEAESNVNELRSLTAGLQDDNQRAAINKIIDDVTNLTAEYSKDMQLMLTPPTADLPRPRTYRGLLSDYRAALGKKHADLDTQINENRRIQEEARATVAASKAEVEQMQKTLSDERTVFASEKQRLTESEDTLKRSLADAKTEIQKINRDYENSRQDFQRQKREAESLVARVTDENQKLKEKVDNYERQVFDLPDGKIVGVSSEMGRVFLNIGSADSLRTNLTFMVYDRTATNFDRERPKATIEVVRITGPHQSEARVVQESPRDPITVDDLILNPVWDPNFRVPIALAGVFDLDFDGVNDVELLRARIEQNGGRVVAYHDDQGNILYFDEQGSPKPDGEIDSKTRWIVRGDNPSVGGEFDPRISAAIRELTAQAERNFVEQIDTRKLLNWMGTHGKAEVEHYGRGENPLIRQDNQFRQPPSAGGR